MICPKCEGKKKWLGLTWHNCDKCNATGEIPDPTPTALTADKIKQINSDADNITILPDPPPPNSTLSKDGFYICNDCDTEVVDGWCDCCDPEYEYGFCEVCKELVINDRCKCDEYEYDPMMEHEIDPFDSMYDNDDYIYPPYGDNYSSADLDDDIPF